MHIHMRRYNISLGSMLISFDNYCRPGQRTIRRKGTYARCSPPCTYVSPTAISNSIIPHTSSFSSLCGDVCTHYASNCAIPLPLMHCLSSLPFPPSFLSCGISPHIPIQTVLWTGKGNTWKTISLGDVIEPKQVKSDRTVTMRALM